MRTALRRQVKDPDGTSWSVGRIWFGKRQLKLDWADRFGGTLDSVPDGFGNIFDGLDFEGGLIALALLIAFVLIIIPVLLFGVELIIVGCLLGIGLVGRSLFGKPWTVVALESGSRRPAAEWRVRGWAPSRALIHHICVEIEAGRALPDDFPGAIYADGDRVIEPASS